MITYERLLQLLHYEPETGVFTWRGARGPAKGGAVAGSIDGDGYRSIMIDGKNYFAHRLAFLWMRGAWPKADIDHWNLNKANNRWTNLRDATSSQNKANTCARVNNTSGYKGVSWHKRDRKWRAEIGVSGKRIFLGNRVTREECAALYATAAKEHFGEFARAQ